jgi:hypothetical protein
MEGKCRFVGRYEVFRQTDRQTPLFFCYVDCQKSVMIGVHMGSMPIHTCWFLVGCDRTPFTGDWHWRSWKMWENTTLIIQVCHSLAVNSMYRNILDWLCCICNHVVVVLLLLLLGMENVFQIGLKISSCKSVNPLGGNSSQTLTLCPQCVGLNQKERRFCWSGSLHLRVTQVEWYVSACVKRWW